MNTPQAPTSSAPKTDTKRSKENNTYKAEIKKQYPRNLMNLSNSEVYMPTASSKIAIWCFCLLNKQEPEGIKKKYNYISKIQDTTNNFGSEQKRLQGNSQFTNFKSPQQ